MKHLTHSLVRASLCCAIVPSLLSLATAQSAPRADKNAGLPAEFVARPVHDHSRPRADDHAPIGVMNEHLHRQGEWMAGLHFMHMSMDGHRAGTDSLSSAAVYSLQAPNGSPYSVAATEMDMDMLMAHVMYAPTDWLTLSAMPSYVWKSMEMETNPALLGGAASAHGHAGHLAAAAASPAGHGSHNGHGGDGRHGHSTEGWGDLPISALFPIWRSDDSQQQLLGALGISIPTGSVDQRENGSYLPYGMQIGSGTWDLLPALTWVHHLERFSYGAQVGARIPLENEGRSGYRHSELYRATTWVSYRVADWVSFNTRLAGSSQDGLYGHYDDSHSHHAPSHFQGNYGGEFVELGVGLNLVVGDGPLRGHRLGFELLFPVYEDANGVGMDRDLSLNLGWQYAF